MAFNYKVMGTLRRMKKDLEREKMLDRIHDLEQVLVGLGHMRANRVTRKKKRATKKKWPKVRKFRMRRISRKSLNN